MNTFVALTLTVGLALSGCRFDAAPGAVAEPVARTDTGDAGAQPAIVRRALLRCRDGEREPRQDDWACGD
jgi:hypothetical protein